MISSERTALFVDGDNIFHATQSMNLSIDWKKLKECFGVNHNLVRSCYFTVMEDGPDQDFTPHRPLVDWLGFNGWEVWKQPSCSKVAIAVVMMELAPRIDHMILLAGNREFVPLLQALKQRGIHITLVHTRTPGNKVSDDLRWEADDFVELETLRISIGRPAKEAVA